MHKEALEIASHAADRAMVAIYPDIEDRLFVRVKGGDHLDLPPEVQRLNAERQRLYQLMDDNLHPGRCRRALILAGQGEAPARSWRPTSWPLHTRFRHRLSDPIGFT